MKFHQNDNVTHRKDIPTLYKEKNIALKFRTERSGEQHPINEMLKIYSKDVLKEFIIQNLVSAEELFYFKRRLATSIAHQSFVTHAFNVG